VAVSFVDCSPDRVGELREFFSEMYWPEYVLSRDEGFLCWMFGDTPAEKRGDNLHIIVSLVDGRIRGCIGYIPVDVTVAGRTVRAAWAANWMVDQQQRRLGLGPLLMRELCSRFAVTLATGPNDDAADLLPRMGWTSFGTLPRYVRILDVGAAAALVDDGPFEWPDGKRTDQPPTGLSAREVNRFDARSTDLWDTTFAAQHAGTRRSADFLNWRYADHPRFPHRLLEVSNGDGTLRGLAVFRVEQVRDLPVRVGRILELIGDSDAQRALLQALAEQARSEDVSVLDFFCSSSQVKPALAAENFISDQDPRAARVPMLFQPLDRRRAGIQFVADLRKARDAAQVEWYVTKSDGDQDRPS
jgi:hypothetical protein